MPDREWVRSDRSAESSRIRKEEDDGRLDSWIQMQSTKQDEKKKFSATDSKTPTIQLKNPERIKREEEAGGVERRPGA